MTRVFVQRGSSAAASSSSSSSSNNNNTNRSSSSSSSPPQTQVTGDDVQEQQLLSEDLPVETAEIDLPVLTAEIEDEAVSEDMSKRISGLRVNEEEEEKDVKISDNSPSQTLVGSPSPPPPPAPPTPPPKPFNSRRIGSSRRATAWPVVSTGSHSENDGYNSADEQNACYGSSYDDAVSSSRFSHFKELNNNQTNTVYTPSVNHQVTTFILCGV